MLPVNNMKCIKCNNDIDVKRLVAVPDTTVCLNCKREDDDDKTIGITTYSHKTAPTTILSTEVGKETIVRALRTSRRSGHHTNLSFGPKNAVAQSSAPPAEGTAEFDSIRRPQESVRTSVEGVANVIPAACHPERPAVTAKSKLCVQCSLKWYLDRLPKEGMRNR